MHFPFFSTWLLASNIFQENWYESINVYIIILLYLVCGNAVDNLVTKQTIVNRHKCSTPYIYVQIESLNLSSPVPNFFLCLQGKFHSIRGISVIIPSEAADYSSLFDPFVFW